MESGGGLQFGLGLGHGENGWRRLAYLGDASWLAAVGSVGMVVSDKDDLTNLS